MDYRRIASAPLAGARPPVHTARAGVLGWRARGLGSRLWL